VINAATNFSWKSDDTAVPAPVLQVITPLLRILEKMHSLKLLHRDIKPENIFLTGLGKFRLGDFGLAIKFDEEVPFSRSGTLDYMAPEVRQGSCNTCLYVRSCKQLHCLALHTGAVSRAWHVGLCCSAISLLAMLCAALGTGEEEDCSLQDASLFHYATQPLMLTCLPCSV
jgi:serine/threonine protein kinase